MYKMLLKTYCVVIFKNWNLIELIVVHNYCKEQMNIKIHNIMHLINIFLLNSTVLELANWLMNA